MLPMHTSSHLKRSFFFLSFLTVVLAGCGVDAVGEVVEGDADSSGTAETALSHPGATAVTVGGPSLVFAYPSQSCDRVWNFPGWADEWGDRADMAARAFIDDQGKVQLYSGYFDMYRMEGASLNSVVRRCEAPVQTSLNSADYATHRSREWLQGFYTKDGRNVAAIASVDWNGYWYTNDSECKDLETYDGGRAAGNIGCWWNKLTTFSSENGGKTFTPGSGVNAWNNVVAAPPGRPGAPGFPPYQKGRYGFFHVTNVLKDPKTGHYFFFTLATGSKANNTNGQKDGMCLMRAWATTSDLANPNAWHGWAGGSAITRPNAGEACQTIKMPPGLGNARFLGYSTYYQQYILVSGGTTELPGDAGLGFSFALSDDLVTWTTSHAVPFYPTKELDYLTLLDPNYQTEVTYRLQESAAARSERRNFDVVGQRPSLYFVEKTDAGYPVLKRISLEFRKERP